MRTKNLSPIERYTLWLDQEVVLPDSQQLKAVKELDQLYRQLSENKALFAKKEWPKGLYLWGKVGIGKTFLMDLFYDSLTQKKKLRLHFQQFMARVHQELKKVSGRKNPLERVAKKFSKEFQILCLDELFITEIGDGMIIYHLLEALFKNGLVLVTTSNFPVDELYKDDLQPRVFDPAVDLLLANTSLIHLNSDQDYRLLQANPQQTYFLTEEANFASLYEELSVNSDSSQASEIQSETILVCKRPIPVVACNNKIAWFTYEGLCCGPRSQLDYLSLAERFETILLSEIPVLGGKSTNQIKARGTEDGGFDVTPTGQRVVVYAFEDNAARRFISLVDALYDQGINLYIEAAVPLDNLYGGDSLNFEFKRTKSRLIEMQSKEYLQK